MRSNINYKKKSKEELQSYSDSELAILLTSLILGKEWILFSEITQDGEYLQLSDSLGYPYFQKIINIYDFNVIIELMQLHNIGLDIDGELLSSNIPTAYHNIILADIHGYVESADYFFFDQKPAKAVVCCLILKLQDEVFKEND